MSGKDASLERLALELLQRGTSLVMAEVLVCVIVTVTSIIGNIFVLVAIYSSPRLRKPSTCTLCHWIFGSALYWLQTSVATMLGTTSLVNMALIAANRLLKVVYPNTHRKRVSVKTISISIFAVWCFTRIIPLSFYITGVKNMFHPGHQICLFDFNTASYTLIAFIAIFESFLPYQVIFICYLKVWPFIKSHMLQMSTSQVNVEDVKLNRLLALIVIPFTLFCPPFFVIILIDTSREQFSLPRQLYFFVSMMVGTASCINPVIYGTMNKEYRRVFVAIFRGRKGRGRIFVEAQKSNFAGGVNRVCPA